MGWLSTPTASSNATFSVTTYKINGLGRYKLAYVCMLMQQVNIDVDVTIDTRHSNVTRKAYVRILKKRLRAGLLSIDRTTRNGALVNRATSSL